MQEYVTEAVVLSRRPSGEADSAVSLFSKRYGKLSAKAKSARKILSKLSAHIEPGNLVRVRLIEKKAFQIADALAERRLAVSRVDLDVLDRLTEDGEPDLRLWRALTRDQFNWRETLRVLGWDPDEARCRRCGESAVGHFDILSQEFVCAACSALSGGARNALLYIGPRAGTTHGEKI